MGDFCLNVIRPMILTFHFSDGSDSSLECPPLHLAEYVPIHFDKSIEKYGLKIARRIWGKKLDPKIQFWDDLPAATPAIMISILLWHRIGLWQELRSFVKSANREDWTRLFERASDDSPDPNFRVWRAYHEAIQIIEPYTLLRIVRSSDEICKSKDLQLTDAYWIADRYLESVRGFCNDLALKYPQDSTMIHFANALERAAMDGIDAIQLALEGASAADNISDARAGALFDALCKARDEIGNPSELQDQGGRIDDLEERMESNEKQINILIEDQTQHLRKANPEKDCAAQVREAQALMKQGLTPYKAAKSVLEDRKWEYRGYNNFIDGEPEYKDPIDALRNKIRYTSQK